MKVRVNNEVREFADTPLSVMALLEALAIAERRGMAVARNMSVVPRSRWETETVEDGDEIEIVRATQGG